MKWIARNGGGGGVRTFKADSLPRAMAKVRAEFGENAMILKTRTYRPWSFLGFGGKECAEILARPMTTDDMRRPAAQPAEEGAAAAGANPFVKRAYSDAEAAAAAMSKSEFRSLRREMENLRETMEEIGRNQQRSQAPPVSEEVLDAYTVLLQNEVAEEIAREIVLDMEKTLPTEVRRDREALRSHLVSHVEGMIPTAGPISVDEARPKVVVFVGPTGVGKTTTIVKIAAQLKLHERRDVGFITMDNIRIAAVDQLKYMADIMGMPLQVASSPAQMRDAIEGFSDRDVILIDTAGRSPFNGLRMNELKHLIEAARPDETHLVVSMTTDCNAVYRVIERFSSIATDRIILTKADEAVTFGLVLNVMSRIDRKLSYVADGQEIPADIHVGEAHALAEMVVGSRERL